MEKISFSLPTEADIEELVANIAPDDAQEILGMGVSPEWGICNSIENSVEVVAIRDPKGRLACIVGLMQSQDLVPVYSPWMIGTVSMQEYPIQVLRLSKKILGRWKAQHPYMENYVDSRHTRAIGWLRHLGAKFELNPEYGPYRRPYYKFTFGSEQWA